LGISGKVGDAVANFETLYLGADTNDGAFGFTAKSVRELGNGIKAAAEVLLLG
jgi:hypothetical protein